MRNVISFANVASPYARWTSPPTTAESNSSSNIDSGYALNFAVANLEGNVTVSKTDAATNPDGLSVKCFFSKIFSDSERLGNAHAMEMFCHYRRVETKRDTGNCRAERVAVGSWEIPDFVSRLRWHGPLTLFLAVSFYRVATSRPLNLKKFLWGNLKGQLTQKSWNPIFWSKLMKNVYSTWTSLWNFSAQRAKMAGLRASKHANRSSVDFAVVLDDA